MVELIFNGSVGMVQKAYWTKDYRSVRQENRSITLEKLLSISNDKGATPVNFDKEGTSIEVT